MLVISCHEPNHIFQYISWYFTYHIINIIIQHIFFVYYHVSILHYIHAYIYIEDIYRYSHIIHGSQNGLKGSLLPLQCRIAAGFLHRGARRDFRRRARACPGQRSSSKGSQGVVKSCGYKAMNLVTNPKDMIIFFSFFLNPFWRRCFWTCGKGWVFESCGGLFWGAVGSSMGKPLTLSQMGLSNDE